MYICDLYNICINSLVLLKIVFAALKRGKICQIFKRTMDLSSFIRETRQQ
jgi:hypothetical protein